jgi:hypothetical protein
LPVVGLPGGTTSRIELRVLHQSAQCLIAYADTAGGGSNGRLLKQRGNRLVLLAAEV